MILPIFLAGVVVARFRLSLRALAVMGLIGLVAYVAFIGLELSSYEAERAVDRTDFYGNIGRSFVASALIIWVGDRLRGRWRTLVAPLVAVARQLGVVDLAREGTARARATSGDLTRAVTGGWPSTGVGPTVSR